jgi:hypothetical protein
MCQSSTNMMGKRTVSIKQKQMASLCQVSSGTLAKIKPLRIATVGVSVGRGDESGPGMFALKRCPTSTIKARLAR